MLKLPLKDQFIIMLEILKVTRTNVKLPKYLGDFSTEDNIFPSNTHIKRFLSTRGSILIRPYISKVIYGQGRGTSLKCTTTWPNIPLTVMWKADGSWEFTPHMVEVYTWLNEFCYKYGEGLMVLDYADCVDYTK